MKKVFFLLLILFFIMGCRKCPQSEVVPAEWKDSNFQEVAAGKFPTIKRQVEATWRCPQPKMLRVPNTVATIAEVLSKNKKVGLYIKGGRSEEGSFLESRWANVYLQFFGTNKNFSIVERGQLDDILKEHGRNMTGIVDPDEDKLTLKMAGATHILFVGRVAGKGGLFSGNNLSGRLVDLETGKVMTIDVILD